MGTIPPILHDLIRKFDEQSDLYRSPDYNETQCRIDFINPLFKALGWDIDNTKSYAPAFREVVHEDAVKIQGTVKSPDYSFRIGGRRIFFLEAKKPALNLRDDTDPAYQLRRYAWTAGLPLSILTSFQEFAVYDCRVPPKYLEKASTARLWHFTYKDYPDRWDEIASIFSPDAIQHGAFDRYVQSNKKSGTQEFDDAFLDEMEDWRKKLANNLALRNPSLDQPGLNFATQRIIDRIIFLRICEDRGVEPPFQLQALLSGDHVHTRLQTLFSKADQRYNSGLFHFRKEKDRHELPDELTPSLNVDDDVLKYIIKRLYYPDSPYVFQEVAADILGSVYERFLGNVIRLTPAHQAKVEPKPEVRKAGGVYYTPTYIVDYIVQNTLGQLLPLPHSTSPSSPSPATPLSPSPGTPGEGRGEGYTQQPHPFNSPSPQSKIENPPTPRDASTLRILDPACGSGSFLLGAYQFLLDWHQHWYLHNDPQKWSKGKNATLRPAPPASSLTPSSHTLSIRERKRILTNNIFGVDLDPAAVEVTKLSLLLKCLEGESAQSINDLLLFHERALPDLGDNIKCGNSLISTDIYDTDAWKQLSKDDQSHLRPFDWHSEFPSIFHTPPSRRSPSSPSPGTPGEGRGEGSAQGPRPPNHASPGFDIIIGNPPYVDVKELGDAIKAQLAQAYRSATKRFDLYVPFTEKSLQLLRADGLLGFILPSMFMRREYGADLRQTICDLAALRSLVDFGTNQVFDGPLNYVAILILQKRCDQPVFQVTQFLRTGMTQHELKATVEGDSIAGVIRYALQSDALRAPEGWKISDTQKAALIDRLMTLAQPLNRILQCASEGIHSGKDEVFFVPSRAAANAAFESPPAFPLAKGKDIHRYDFVDSKKLRHTVIYPYDLQSRRVLTSRELKQQAPNVWAYLQQSRPLLKGRPYFDRSDKEWYELWCPRDPDLFRLPKIVGPEIANRGEFTLCHDPLFVNNKLKVIQIKPDVPERLEYLLGILNSALLVYAHRSIAPPKGNNYFEVKTRILGRLPIRRIDFSNKTDKSAHDRLVALVTQMLSLHQSLAAAQAPADKESLQRQITATDKQIDALVYGLYSLTPDEIKIVEQATQ